MSQQRSRTPTTPAPPQPVLRRQSSRREREQRRQRIAIGAVLGGILLTLFIIAVPFLKRTVWDPSRQLAVVGEQTITRGAYEERQKLNSLLGTDPSVLGGAFAVYRRNPEQFRNALEQAQSSPDTASTEVTADALDPMIDDAVLVESAGQVGADISDGAVDKKLRGYLHPAGAPATAGAATPSPAAPTPTVPAPGQPTQPAATPTLGPPTDENVDGFFEELDNSIGVSKEDYGRMVVQPAIVRETYLAKNAPKAAEQVHARHILVGTKQEAEKVLQDLRKGTKFEVLARQRSQDTGNAPKGGDLGWAPREQYVAPFAKAAFALKKPGDLSGPVQTEFGWHVIQLLERSDSRPLSKEQQDQIGARKLEEFIKQRREQLRREDKLEIGLPPTPAPTTTAQPAG